MAASAGMRRLRSAHLAVTRLCPMGKEEGGRVTAPARFTKTDVTRAMKGARDAGYDHVRVTIDVHGTMIIDVSDSPTIVARANPLDRLLPK